MNDTTLLKAIKSTLESWDLLDDSHKGKYYEVSRNNLETWLKELENNNVDVI